MYIEYFYSYCEILWLMSKRMSKNHSSLKKNISVKNFMKPFYLWFYPIDIWFGFPEKTEQNRAERNRIPNNTKSCVGSVDHWIASLEFYFSKFYGKVGGISWFLPSHLKKFRSLLRFWLEKLNCGFFHSLHSRKNTTKQLFQSKFQCRK